MEHEQAHISFVYNSTKTDFFNEKRFVFDELLAYKAEPLLKGVIDNEIISEEEIQEIIDLKVQTTGWPREAAEEVVRSRIKLIQIGRENIELTMRAKNAEERAEMAEQIANTDKLTEVANRHAYNHKIQNEISHYGRKREPLSLIMVDIDHFKKYNDDYGHNIGDEVLKLVAKILQNNLPRATDMVARYGGEEFFVVLPDTPSEGAEIVAEKLRIAIEQETIQWAKEKTLKPVTISLGYATLDTGHEELDRAEKIELAADTALYHSKKEGRNRVTAYKKGLEMPSQLEKLAKKLFYLQHDIERLQDNLSKELRIVGYVKKSNDKDLVIYMNKKIAELGEKISKSTDEIRSVEEAANIERLRAVA